MKLEVKKVVKVASPSNSLPISSFLLFPLSLSLSLSLLPFLCHARYALSLSFSLSRSPSCVLFFLSWSFSFTSSFSCDLSFILGLFGETKINKESKVVLLSIKFHQLVQIVVTIFQFQYATINASIIFAFCHSWSQSSSLHLLVCINLFSIIK